MIQNIEGYADKYKDQIEGCMRNNQAMSTSDTEIERTLGECVCAHFLIPAAKNLRDRDLLNTERVLGY
jgi:hypothetical protein